MTARTILSSDGSFAETTDLPSRDAWAHMAQADLEAQIRVLADRGIDEAFLVILSGQSLPDVRRILGSRP